MGQILSKRHQNHHHHHHHSNHGNHHHHHHHHHHHQPLTNPPPPTPPPPPPLAAPRQQASHPNPVPPPAAPQVVSTSFTFAANAPYPSLPPPLPTPPPPQPQPQPQPFSYYPQYNYSNYARPDNLMGAQPGNYYHPYFVGHGHGNAWDRQPAGMQLPVMPPPPPVPYVDHQSAKKIKNDVNVHKDTIKLEVDEKNRDCHLVSFTFDAMVDGSITIYYYAKEGTKCTFNPIYPEMYVPVKIPFQKGLGQKFCQTSGSGIDLGFFDVDDLSKPFDGDVFPLVILAESSSLSTSPDGQLGLAVEAGDTSPHAQITQAVIEKKHDNGFKVKVIKQILWIDEVRYELREIFGSSDPDEVTINDKDSGKECVICMTDPKDTAVLPCRHMCMCSECAKELRMKSNKCPICRQPIEELLEIKVDEGVS